MFDTLLTASATLARQYPELLLFLSLGIGYTIGNIKIKGFSLGATASVLITALILGQFNVTIAPLIKTVAFALFIFTIGYKVGPQFFSGLKKEGIKYTILALFVAIVSLATAYILGKLFGFDKGTTAGLLGGAMTQSSIIGTAQDAIKNLGVPSAEQALLTSHIAIAYAITYIFGVAGLILFYKFVPKLLGINLQQEAKEITSDKKEPETPAFNQQITLRAYQITNPTLIGITVADLEKLLDHAVRIEKIKRGSALIDPTPDTVFATHDHIVLIAPRTATLKLAEKLGPEIDDHELLNVPNVAARIFITKKNLFGAPLHTLQTQLCPHVLISTVTMQGHEVPLNASTQISRGTILHVIGLKKYVHQCAQALGYLEKKTKASDLATVGFGCFAGTLIGLITITLGTIPLTLSVGGGILLAGLILGWLRSVHPTFGFIPDGAQWLLTELGLNLFIACVGITAGPKAVEALFTNGPSLFLAGTLVTLLPTTLGLIFGRLVLRLDYILLLGALTGAGTATPALNVLKNDADSFAPVLGYTVPYAIGNFVLTIWGTVIVYLM